MAQPTAPRYNPAVPDTPMRPNHDLDKFHEECALFGIYGTADAAAHTALGLHALQHRGQEASGIVTTTAGISTITAPRALSATSSANRPSSPR